MCGFRGSPGHQVETQTPGTRGLQMAILKKHNIRDLPGGQKVEPVLAVGCWLEGVLTARNAFTTSHTMLRRCLDAEWVAYGSLGQREVDR